ncbi:MAG: GAF domain-containing protein, partial [Proteobacteria bacterium]|nr:GAF domain-containing protein [Pseudomonadota bacterium]
MSDSPDRPDNVEAMESRFRDALNKIAHDPRFNDVELGEVVEFISKTAADVLDCERASVWEYFDSPEDGKYIFCLSHHDQSTGLSTSGGQLGQDEASSYLNALNVDKLLIINDVATDPRCLELNQEYLPSNNISSMLDSPYQFNGKLAGVLCLEHVGAPRKWSLVEQHFCTNMATIASERQYRRSTESKLREEEDRYRSLVEDLAHGLVIIVDEKVVFANKAAADLTRIEQPEIMTGMRLSELFPGTSPLALKDWENEVR